MAEYYRAWDTWQAGQLTNALTLFTNFLFHYPTNEFFPRAQIWVADFYYTLRNHVEAERNYKLLSQNTNWGHSQLGYEAQLMAGRAAMDRPGGGDAAQGYFRGLWNNTNGPSLDLRLQALFLYGDTLISMVDPADTNMLANCEEATRAFGLICDQYPTNRLAVRAWGRRGDCNLQWALARQQYRFPDQCPQRLPASRRFTPGRRRPPQ